MDNVNWEYQAPKFIDFEANEHLDDVEDEFFENSSKAQILDVEPDNQQHQEDEEITKTSDPFMNTPSRETYGVKTPSRVLRSCLEKENMKRNENTEIQPAAAEQFEENNVLPAKSISKTPSTVASSIDTPRILRSATKEEKIQPIPFKVDDEIDGNGDQKENKLKILSNIVTPSRIDSWKSSKVTFNAGKFTEVDKNGSRKKTNIRRTMMKLPKKEPQPDPPKKKLKKDTHPMRLTTTINEGIPHSHKDHKRYLSSENRQFTKSEAVQVKEKIQLKRRDHSTPNTLNKHVTRTKEFHFKTDERASKTHNMSTRADASEKSDFESGLRKYAPSPVKRSRSTVVKPFNLTKRKLCDQQPKTNKFIPMAKAILDFQSRTPKRFKMTSNRTENKPKPMRATIPKTPNITKKKNRPVLVMSAQEKEDLEVEDMRKHQFKANPVNPALLQAPQQIKQVEKKPPTVPVEFHLSTASHSHKEIEKDKNPKPFSAQPVPEFIFEKPSKTKKKKPSDVTVPMSPAFALKSRLKPKINELKPNAPTHKFYHPPPNPSHTFKPKLQSTSTNPQPFSFHDRDKERFNKKMEKVKEIKEKETAPSTFKAQPMPLPVSPSLTLPPKKTKEPTKAEPFNLKSDERAASRLEEWEKQIENEAKEMKEKAEFKANNTYEKVIKGKPWEPILDHKPPTETLNVVLRSELRAKEREEFDSRLQEEIRQKEKVLEEERVRQAEAHKKEIEELRKNQIHKAQEIHKFKDFQVTRSCKPLTNPESPKFSTRFNK